MALPLPRPPLAAALLLLAASPGPAARAQFESGAALDLGAVMGLDVRAAAGLEDGSLVVLDGGPSCRICTTPEAKSDCPHSWRPRLVHLRPQAAGPGGGETWQVRTICSLSPTVGGILGVQGGAVFFNDLVAGVVRLPLVRRGGTLGAGPADLFLGPVDLLAMGIPFGCLPSLALAPDGGLVLAFDDGVALLPPGADRTGPAGLRWLLGRPPTRPLPPGERPALIPSVASDGTIFVVDRSKRAVFRFAAGDRKLSIPAKGEGWPGAGFVPILPAAHGDTLLVCGQDLDRGTAALAALAPGRSPASGPARYLDLKLGLGEAVRFTPQGDLLVTDVRQGGLRLVRARVPAATGAGAGTESKVEAKAGFQAEAKDGPGAGAATDPKAGTKVDSLAEARVDLLAESKAGPAPVLPAAAAAPEEPGPTAGQAAEGPALRPVDKRDRPAITGATLAFAESKAFDRAFGQWARPLGGAGAAPGADGLSPVMNPFALGYGGLKQVVRWMLRNADEANHPVDMAEWLAAGKPARPRFSFGLYRHARHGGVVLEIQDLEEWAARIDDDAGGARVARELAPAGGAHGLRPDRDRVPRYYRGLTVTLGPDGQSLRSIHPGGAPALPPPGLESKAGKPRRSGR